MKEPKSKTLALLLGAGPGKGPEEPEEGDGGMEGEDSEGGSELEVFGKDLIAAVQRDDPTKVGRVIKAMVDYCKDE